MSTATKKRRKAGGSETVHSRDTRWDDPATIPRPPPAGDGGGTSPARVDYGARLCLALQGAVKSGDLPYVRAVFDDPALVETLTFVQDSKDRLPWCRKAPGSFETLSPSSTGRYPKWGDIFLNLPLPCLYFKHLHLLAKACKLGHTEIAEELIRRGADPSWGGELHGTFESYRTPLVSAIRARQIPSVELLIDAGCFITDPKTKVIRPLHNRPHCETPLTAAVEEGLVQVVRLLIERGAIDQVPLPKRHVRVLAKDAGPYLHGSAHCVWKKNSYKDDHYLNIELSCPCYCEDDTEKVVSVSVNEALYQAWRRALDSTNHATILEMIAHNMGAHEKSVISMLLGRSLKENIWAGCSGYFERYHDRSEWCNDNFRCGWPSRRAVAVVRGLRYTDIDCLRASGAKLSDKGIERLEEKKAMWIEYTTMASQRFSSSEKVGIEIQCWSELIRDASRPWSRRNHHLFPMPVRSLARELLLIGFALSLRYDAAADFIKDVWESEIMPHVVG